ncbi:MAG: peptidyl-prolyl cis-trans isomerase [Bacteroidaceae bacterium]|nr:peptidyl-prolyl cis-trans isomerase [Bacteroidaceae bacterium]
MKICRIHRRGHLLKLIVPVTVQSVLLLSCGWNASTAYERGKTPLVELKGSVLYEEDLLQVLPLGLTGQDSIDFSEQYIRNWVEDVMFYQNAERNIPDTRDIDRLVNNYRRSLIEHEYQRRLLEQKFSAEITDEDITDFYNDNSGMFVLNESLIKGLFLKIPAKAPDLQRIKTLFTQTDEESFEEIEKYCIRNSARCEFFYDNWRNLAEIEVMMPQSGTPLEDLLDKQSGFEIKDEDNIYLLNVSEYLRKGGTEPLEYARGKVRMLLINNNEVSYMRKIREELYQSAVDKGLIEYHRQKR